MMKFDSSRFVVMAKIRNLSQCVAVIMLLAGAIGLGQSGSTRTATFALASPAGLEVIHGEAEAATYRGRRAVHLRALTSHGPDDVVLALLSSEDFKDGTIELEVAGAPLPTAPADDRGFIGVAFHTQAHGARWEAIYLRPTNGRSDDQLRRNHSVQYESAPEYPWHRLRSESPGVYESYVDLEAGAWTRMKIVVSRKTARLYVNGSEQPCLIVNDLKLGETHGQIALWAYWSTDAYFSNLKIYQ